VGEALEKLKKKQEERWKEYAKALADLQAELAREIQKLTEEVRQEAEKLQKLVTAIEEKANEAEKSQADIEAKTKELETALKQFEARWGGLGQNLGQIVRNRIGTFFPLTPVR